MKLCVLLNAYILMQFTQFSFIFFLLTDWHKIMFSTCKFQNCYFILFLFYTSKILRSQENKRRENFLLNNLQLEIRNEMFRFCLARNYQHVSSCKVAMWFLIYANNTEVVVVGKYLWALIKFMWKCGKSHLFDCFFFIVCMKNHMQQFR